MLPDGSDARMRRLRYTGPGAVLVSVAHERVQSAALALTGRRSRLTVRGLHRSDATRSRSGDRARGAGARLRER